MIKRREDLQAMKSIIAFTFLLVAVNGNPFAGSIVNPCNLITPDHPKSGFRYAECDLECVVNKETAVRCWFTIGEDNTPSPVNATKSKFVVESCDNSIDFSDIELCISTKTIGIADLPLENRSQCVKCNGGTDSSGSTSAKCNNLSNITYTSESMFAIQAHGKNNFISGAIWKVPSIQPKSSKLQNVEIDVDVHTNNIVYQFYINFN